MYITDTYCISPQKTFVESFFLENSLSHKGNRYVAIEPNYSEVIPNGILRRMGKAVRMGVGSGMFLLQKNDKPDGIILSTANGGLEDCLKFLNQIVDYKEGTLTPTNFVQSTPNAVAGSLALLSTNTGYNITHVNKGLAFEAALMDAILLFEEKKATRLLLGNIEEISDYNYNIDYLAGIFKDEAINSESLLSSNTKGTVCGEGAAMFILEEKRSEKTIAKICDAAQFSFPKKREVVSKNLTVFLNKNGIEKGEVDVLILGLSGDNRTDFWYSDFLTEFGADVTVLSYKNLVGEYPTSSSFATYFAAQILKGKTPPKESVYKEEKKPQQPKHALIYNHYKGIQHSFILLSK